MAFKFFKRCKDALVLGALLVTIGATKGATNNVYVGPQVLQPVPAPAGENELIIKFRATASDSEIANSIQHGKLKVKKHLQTLAMRERNHPGLTRVESELPIDEAIAKLKNHPAVEYVEKNVTYKHQSTSNDPYVTGNYTWGLYGDLSSPANAFGSQAAEAWSAGYTGTNGVIVAVVDEGIDISHPDLAPNIWVNPYDPVDGVDNDGNGYVDDVNGWDFANNSRNVFVSGDDHATHVAGTIGARGGNGSGLAGVNWNVTIMSGRFLGPSGGDTLAAVEAIDYFVDMKKRHNLNLVAINASWGGSGYSQSLNDAIIRAAKAGILFVAAAGNSALNNDNSADYPANIDTRRGTSTESAASFDGVIAVAAIDSTGALASFSNYGATTVHLGAPGVHILSTYPGSQYAYMDGTSMATPHVTGAVALYASTHPGASAQSIRDALLASVTPTYSLSGKTTTGGRLNLSSVIAPTQTAPPPATNPPPAVPTGVNTSSGVAAVSGNSTVIVRWTASAGAASYNVKRATSSAGPWTVVASGVTSTSWSQTVSATGARYYYEVSAVNSAGESLNSSAYGVTPQPPTPVNVAGAPTSSTTLQLTWTDRSSDELGFKVEYWTGSSWVEIGATGANTTSVTVSGVSSAHTYWFRVRAYNASYVTIYSNQAPVTMP